MFWVRYCSFYTLLNFFTFENKLIGYADDSTLMAVIPSLGVRVAVAKSLICDLGVSDVTFGG